jgi:hypothetical protein
MTIKIYTYTKPIQIAGDILLRALDDRLIICGVTGVLGVVL